MSAIRGARERARIEVTAAIKDEARKQLAAEGAAKLSLRAVARELGMVSSALYRYFPSRDELLTALIVDAYDSVGEAAEHAHRTATAEGDGRAAAPRPPTASARTAPPTASARTAPPTASARTAPPTASARTAPPAPPAPPAVHLNRWVAVACAVRDWALAHPHEYALIYGSPVPGYTAPQATVGPASRVGLTLIAIVVEAHEAQGIALPPLAGELRPEAERLAADLAPGLPPAAAARLVAAWSQLFGLVSFEIFGQFNRVVEDREVFFRQAAAELARTVGLLDGHR
ncbi:TetR/AcrR family transcriptional regulator [Streptomyces sp. NBC_00338]|uniref:TetR/AcrR family transcriptional regulator n=1 Tax=Streptomyces sp. NBC_00338 TaxID=2975715 RepID=UPI00225560C4|nr:WHG domain-containing protein [Streptomyces sp. NBC_00338]MCX5138485.1 WHG domain-containing protein [Streptomyces sp. NBC_00338]